MASVVIDTDVVSFIFKNDTRARLFRKHLMGRSHVISFMTLAELRAWVYQHRWGQGRRDHLARAVARYAVYYPDELLCDRWADVDNRARRKGRPIQCADAWIAASALMLNVPLVTNNPGDYAGVDGLTVLSAATP